MDRVRMTVLVAAAAALTLCASAHGQQMPQAVTDATITSRVLTAFSFHEEVSPLNIRVVTNNRVVTLSGSVRYDDQRELAETVARGVQGVEKVVNDILVVPEVVPERKRGWRQASVDKAVTASVKARLMYHKQVQGLQVGIRTRRNVVTLYGVVGTEEQKAKMGQIAEETRGVERVINNISVRSKEELPPASHVRRQFSDGWVETQVETSLLLNRHVNIKDLNVEVDEGVCYLTGVVRQKEQKELAESIAFSIQGVQRVQNDLQVIEVEPPPNAPPALEPAPVDLSPLDASTTNQQGNTEPDGAPADGEAKMETMPPAESNGLDVMEPLEVEELEPPL